MRALFNKKPSGKKKLISLFIFVLVISGIFLVGSSQSKKDKVSEEVYEILEDNEEIPVKIKIEKDTFSVKNSKKNIKDKINGKAIISETNDEIIVSLNEAELNELNYDSKVKKISYSPQFTAFLEDSVPQINASVIWPVNLSSQNITGINETVCIIDTGINFSHVDLAGKNKTCVIDCYNKDCVENCSIHDDNGHGTHVAGIAAASGGINGVATGANLIGLKVLDENGDAHGSTGTEDIRHAIDWCVANRVAYNISVISMSLGTTVLYTTACDGTFANLTTAINNATLYNISVVSATGNAGSTTAIASPACIQNATAVSSIGKDDSTFAHNRNSITDLIAPGGVASGSGSCSPGSMDPTRICSTYNDGAYIAFSGTSMATPHVAGAFAMFRQFFRLQNGRVPTPSEMESTFDSTAKQINDSSGSNLNYSRIDVHAAIVSIDSSNPTVSLLAPGNNTIQFTQNVTFNCSANDAQLDNLTLYVWHSNGSIYNNTEFVDVDGVNGYLEKNITDLSYGNYEWNCLAYDENNNLSFASSNFTLTIGHIRTTLDSPANNTFTNQNQTYNCSAETEPTKELTNITFSIWNSTGNLVYNASGNVNGTTNSSLFYYNFTSEESYTWNCLSYNNETESDWANSNLTITYDVSDLGIENISSSVSTTTATVSWDTNESANATINYGTTTNLGTLSINSTLAFNHSFSLTGLSASTTYYYNVTSCDQAGNCVTNGTNSFATSAAPVTTTNGGDDTGGGGPTPTTHTPNATEASAGYRKSLAKNDKIKFTIFDGENGEHALTLDYVGSNFINLTIRSSPIKLSLGIGQRAKLNLTSLDYYDLFIKLNSIAHSKADITIQTIHEKIPVPAEITGEVVDGVEEEEKPEIRERVPEIKLNRETLIYGILLILVIIGVIILLRKKSGKKKREKTKEEYKEKFEKNVKPKKKAKK